MSESTKGGWITVRPDDERIESGSRVRVGTIEATVIEAEVPWLCLRDPRLYVHRYDGPDVELWVSEVTLPLPTEPGPFWGRIERDGDAYVGWVLWVVDHDGAPYWTTHRVGGSSCHYREHVTVLPLPDDRREALR